MTDQRDKAITEPAGGVEEPKSHRAAAPLSRRALLSGASVALPTILTLNSNSAFGWAITSGTIGTRGASTVATGDDAYCVIGPEVPGKPGVYPLGDQTDIYRIPGNLTYRTGKGNSGDPLSPEQACTSSLDTIYYRYGTTGDGTPIRPLGGAVASLTSPGALASFTGNVSPLEWI